MFCWEIVTIFEQSGYVSKNVLDAVQRQFRDRIVTPQNYLPPLLLKESMLLKRSALVIIGIRDMMK
jgi:hypothetical protein